MASIVGARGQITLEKELRDALGVAPGWRALQRRVGDHIELHFLPPRHRRSLRGVLSDASGPHYETDDELRRATEMARAQSLAEEYGKPVL